MYFEDSVMTVRKPSLPKKKVSKKSNISNKKKLLTAYTEVIKKELLAALDSIENSELVKKIEKKLEKFQKMMISESVKLSKDVKKSIKPKKKIKPKKIIKKKIKKK